MRDEDIDLSDIPEVTAEQMAKAMMRVGGKRVSKSKVRVSMLLDAEVVAYFKQQAGDENYQSLINATLKTTIGKQSLEALLRRVIREELQTTH